jgi:serine phosphatase RsbU (regulator of sigma subunit)
MIKHFKYLFFIFLTCALSAKAGIPDSLINTIDFSERSYDINISKKGNENSSINLYQNWLFINDDKPGLRFGNGEEVNYTIVNGSSGLVFSVSGERSDEVVGAKPTFVIGGSDENNKALTEGIFETKFNGIAWYKCYFKTPKEFVNKIYELEFILHGAVEIYLDGELQTSVGKINSNPGLAEELNITDGNIYFPINDTAVHCLAIRFGLPNHLEYRRKYPNVLQRPSFQFSMPEIKDFNRNALNVFFSITNMLSAFFFALFIIHLLIYFFYREQSFNLLYSLFLILLSLTFLELYVVRFIQDLRFYLWLDNFDNVIFPTVCFILVTLLNKLLNEKPSWHYKFLCIVLVYHYIDVLFIGKFQQASMSTIIFYTYFNTLAHSIKGIRRKVPSAKFLGWGILSCTISILLLIVIVVAITLFSYGVPSDAWVIATYSCLLIIAILSIPISMSAFLAYDFASTSRSLSKKLIEVEELSERSIEQEKEKQKILAEQNEMLESQVLERTKEINEQKKIIEEKNKDITDSINYAQRIQRSILPTDNEIKEIFENNFVLFKPRDIVSGDFYQFKKNGDYNYAILADCTGHGVPGALMSMIGSNLLKQIILERGVKEPNAILSELHKEVRITLRQTSGVQSHDGMDASVLLMHKKKLFIASANRPVYIVKNGELTELKPDKRSIGGSQSVDEIAFNVIELEAEAGMMLYLFSDGYADQFGGEAGKKFKVKNLSQLLLSIHAKPLSTQKEILDTTFDNWKKDLEQVDDVSLIGIRF